VILGLDTATASTAVAVWAPDGPAVERRDDPPPEQRPGHAARLLVLIDEALREADADWPDIERIGVGVGPGGFTGLRLGIATARALSQARDIPLAGVSSLEALRLGVRPLNLSPTIVYAVIDARRGEVFAAAWREDERILAPVAIAPGELAGRLEPGALAVGDGAVRFREELERAGATVPADGSPAHRVSALEVCRLAARGAPADRDVVLPDYRREPDAKPPRLP
jgi:tRNA threonylcarbamoyladenosine biosynthesis protein TsaB